MFYSEIALVQKLLLLHHCKGYWMSLDAVYKDLFECSAISKLLPSLSQFLIFFFQSISLNVFQLWNSFCPAIFVVTD